MTLVWLKGLLSRQDATQSRSGAPLRAAGTSPRDEARKWPETARKSRSALDEAGAFLLEVLAMGPRPSKEVQAEAKARGISWATLRRAMRKAGVEKRKVGFQGRWVLEIQTCSGNSKDAQCADMSTFVERGRCEPDAEGEETAKEVTCGDQDLSEASRTLTRPDPDAGQVPAGFTIPPGVECVSWDLKSAPLKLDLGVTVLNAEDLVTRHLEILAAKLCGDKSWLCEQWTLDILLADLNDVGVELRILE